MTFTNTQKGIAFIAVGLLLLLQTLHALGWGINVLFIVGSITLIVWGFILLDGHKFVIQAFNKFKKLK